MQSPGEGLKLMVALLSLENSLLRIKVERLHKKVALESIKVRNLEEGGGPFGTANYERMAKDLQYYQVKTTELQLELSRKNRKDGPELPTQPIPTRIPNPVLKGIHDIEISRENANQRNELIYSRKIGNVRVRSLMVHTMLMWLDYTRVRCADSKDKSLLSTLAFSTWFLKSRFKVDCE